METTITTTHPVQRKINKEDFDLIISNQEHPHHKLVVHEHIDGHDVYYIRFNEWVRFHPGSKRNRIILYQ